MNLFLEWRDEWCLGIHEIDRQHMQLAELLNHLADLLQIVLTTNPSTASSMLLVRQLMEQTRQHFKDEESIMREHDYPHLVDHHRQHLLLLTEIQDFISQIEAGSRQFDYDSLTAMKHCLIDHVAKDDMDFASYLEQE